MPQRQLIIFQRLGSFRCRLQYVSVKASDIEFFPLDTM